MHSLGTWRFTRKRPGRSLGSRCCTQGARVCADGDVNYEECGEAGKRGGERSGRETPKALSVLARVEEDDKEKVKDCRRVVVRPDAGPRDQVTRPIGDGGLN